MNLLPSKSPKKSLWDILTGAGFDSHTPPFYYVVLHFWLTIFPVSEIGLRSLSTFCDLFALVVFFNIVAKQFNLRLAQRCTGVYTISSFAIYYAQEGRMYSLLVCLVLITYFYALKYCQNKLSTIDWVCLIITGICGLYTHYYYALSLAAIFLSVCYHHKECISKVKNWTLAMVLIGVCFLPWIPVILGLMGGPGQHFRRHVFATIPYSFFRFFAGYGVMPLQIGSKSNLIATIVDHAPSIAAFTIFFGLITLKGTYVLISKAPKQGLFLLIPTIFPVLAASIISLKTPMLSERYLITIFPFIAVLSSIGLWNNTLNLGSNPETGKAQIVKTIGFLLLLVALAGHFTNASFGNTDWRGASRFLAQQKNHDPIYVVPGYTKELLHYYENALALHDISPNETNQLKLDSFPKQFWVVEREGSTFQSDIFKRYKEVTISNYKIFPHENGLRVYLVTQNTTD